MPDDPPTAPIPDADKPGPDLSGARDDPPSTLAAAASRGDREAAEALFVAVYDELRGIAERLLRREQAGHMLQPTALVNEAYFKMVGGEPVDAEGTTHFRAIAVRAMGQVLVDHARHENRQKRGGEWRRVSLDVALMGAEASQVDALALKEALDALDARDARLAQIVQLRLFGEFSHAQVAALMGISVRHAEREWAYGRAWLRRRLLEGDGT